MGKKVLLCIWDNGFRDRKTTPDQEHSVDATTQDATTQFPRRHPHRLRRPPPGQQCRAGPTRHVGPAPGSAPTGPGAPRPGQCAGPSQHGRQDGDPGGVSAGWGRLHRRRRLVAHRRDGQRSRLRGQGAIHPVYLPAQLPVGRCPPVGSGEPRAAGPGLGCWGRTRRRAVDHRPGLHHLRDLRSGQGGCPPPQLYRPAGLSPADGPVLGCWGRHRRRADVSAARGPRQHGSGRRPLPA